MNGVRWVVRRELADFLLDAGALDVWKLAEHPSVRLVKKGQHRVVFRVSLPRDGHEPLELFVKIFLLPHLRDLLRYMVRQGRGMKEWKTAQVLERIGIPTVRCVAVGSRRVAGVLREDCIITEAVPDVVPLDRFVSEELGRMTPAEQGRLIRGAAPVLAEFVRRLHDGGVHHHDFHGGNILLRKDVEGIRRLLLIDLHVVTCGGPLPLGARLRNLTQLNRFFSTAVSRTARLRFWKQYLRGIPFLERTWREYARLVEEHTVSSRRSLWKSRDRYCLRTNKAFRRFHLRGMRGHTVRGQIRIPEEVLKRIGGEGLVLPDAVLLKDSLSTRVWEQTVDFGTEHCTIVIKHERREWGAKLLRTFLRRVGALREWRLAYAMRIRGLPVVEPLAAMERRTMGLLRESYLVTRKVENVGNLEQFVQRTFTGELSQETRRLRRRMARSLGRLIRALHACGFTQRDLKPANILVCPADAVSSEVRFTLVDFKGTRQRTRVSEPDRARDLARLAAGFVGTQGVRTTDMMRFLDEYLSGSGMSHARRRTFLAMIDQGIQEKRRRRNPEGLR